MGSNTWVLIYVFIALIFFIVLFGIVDFFTKSRSAKAKPVKESTSVVKVEEPVILNKSESEIVNDTGSNLFNDIEALMKAQPVKDERPEMASQRSRMLNRRARMLQYYDEKYKSRAVSFDGDDFDEPLNAPSQSFIVDGVEITQDDVKKLTALHGLFARKTDTE